MIYQTLVEVAEYLNQLAEETEEYAAVTLANKLEASIAHIDERIPDQRTAFGVIRDALTAERRMRERVFRDNTPKREAKVAEIDKALAALDALVPLEAPDKTPQQQKLIA